MEGLFCSFVFHKDADSEQGNKHASKSDVDLSIARKSQLSNSSVFLSNLSYEATEADIEKILKNVSYTCM
jgi:RNA recognition motif-containing protein